MRSARSSVVAVALLAGSMLALAPSRAEAQGSVAFFPSVGSAPDGVSLNVTPVVTADRRYVRLAMNPTFSVINGFNSFPVFGAVGGGGNGGGLPGGGGGGLGGLGGGPGGGHAGGGFRSVGLGVPYRPEYLEASLKADAQVKAEQAKPIKGRKPTADPVMVPMSKDEKKRPPGARRG